MYITIVLIVAALAFTHTNSFIIQGKVIDETGAPVSGASILVRGTSIGVSADINGNFSIELPGKNSVLVISVVGCPATEVRVVDEKNLIIKITRFCQNFVGSCGYLISKKTKYKRFSENELFSPSDFKI